MDFRDSPEQAEWRAEVRTFLDDYLHESITGTQGWGEEERTGEHWERWRQALAERGFIAAGWPKEYGGAGLTAAEQFILNQEFAERNAPNMGGMGVMMLGPTLITHGTEAQKQQHLPKILSGETRWCQGYSEPESGSDLASLQTKAVKDGDEWVINGQKIWTSGAHTADWCFMLARSDPDAPKHRGISYFLVDMKSPGITVRPLINLANGHGFNEVFFEDVRVPAENVVGEVNRGWYVGATTLDFERSSIGNSVGVRQSVERQIDWLKKHKDEIPPTSYQAARKELADRWIEIQTGTTLAYRIVSMQVAGEIPNYEASIAKLFNTELSQRVARTGNAMVGMWGAVTDRKAPMKGTMAETYMTSISATIAGGTSEIQRNIVATRGLGLPRG